MWERLKWTERFSFVNRSQVHHVVADDLVSADWVLYQWQAEIDQTMVGVQRVGALMTTWGWPQQEQKEVVFISGNVDEIMTRYMFSCLIKVIMYLVLKYPKGLSSTSCATVSPGPGCCGGAW